MVNLRAHTCVSFGFVHTYICILPPPPMWLSLSVAGLNFTDRDLDASELGGEVVWQIPEEPQLARYMVYLPLGDAKTIL